MLQTYKSSSFRVKEGGTLPDIQYSGQQSPSELFGILVGFIRRQWLVALSVVPLTIALAAVYLFTTPPMYKGQARILIDTDRVQVLQRTVLGEDPINYAVMDTQLEILKSKNFALSVIKSLGLTKDPEFVGSSSGLLGSIQNLLSRPLASVKLAFASNQSESDFATQHAVDVFENRLTVSRVGASYVIEIEFRSTDRDRAAKITNAVADEFIADQLEAKYQTIRRATAWLQDRLTELRGQAAAAERAVVEYKTRNNIVDTGGRLINEQQLAELNTALVKARADTQEAEARLNRISQIAGTDLDPTETVTDTLRNPIITTLRQQYLALAQREAIYSNRYGKDHLSAVNLRNQMREIRHSIADELKQIIEAYKSEYSIAKAREQSLQSSLAASVAGSQTTNKAQVELRQLESAAQTYRALYDGFQQRYMDAVQQQSSPMTEARVISRATRPSTKTSPKSFLVLGVATMGGLALGIALGILREISDRVFRTSGQVETELKTECLALVPRTKPSDKVRSVGIGTSAGVSSSRVVALGAGVSREVIDLPLARFAELIRAVKVGMDLSGMDKPARVIGVTSSLPNEGKSTVATALAQLSAHSGARVILVDCDLRKPSLSKELAPNATAGLIEVVTGSASLEEVIWTDPSTKLSFLPVVARSRLTHTHEILASNALRRLFDQLHDRYDYIIVDLSPLAPVVRRPLDGSSR